MTNSNVVFKKNTNMWEDNEQLQEIRKIYCPNLNDIEFKTFVGIGKATQLNPFLRELWAVKYGNQSANIFIGRDGYRKAAQKNPDYDYHIVDAVYENDEFTIENGIVKHSYQLKNRGKLVGAYCTVKRKSATQSMFVFVERGEYDLNRSVWKEKPATMLKKVSESQALRMAFQNLFAGTYDESENWMDKKQTEGQHDEILQRLQDDDSKNASQTNTQSSEKVIGQYEMVCTGDETVSDCEPAQAATTLNPSYATEEQIERIDWLLEYNGHDKQQIFNKAGIEDLTQLTQKTAQKWLNRLQKESNN